LRRIANWIHHALVQCRDAVLVTLRGSEILLRLSPLLLLTPASVAWSHFTTTTTNNSNHHKNNIISDWTWAYLRSTVTALGPAFCKLGQWVATRRDIFPAHVCDRLSVLQDQGLPHAWRHTESALVEAFGPDYAQQLTVEHNQQPRNNNNNNPLIGCGSAAQVYRGTLRTTVVGSNDENEEVVEHHYRPVAIKVLHPRLEQRMDRDLWFVQTVANLLHNTLPPLRLLNLPRAVSNFGAILRRQADLTVEADNLKRFRHNFYQYDDSENADEHKGSKILFPRPMEGWISKDVLVEDLVDNATPIAEFLNDSTPEGIQIRKELASPLLRAFLKMVFIDNLSHGDLHAGNVLIQTSTVEQTPKTDWSIWFPFLNISATSNNGSIGSNGQDHHKPIMETRRQIVFLDAGIATTLSHNDQRNLRDLFRAVILNEGDRAGRLMVERARYERCSQTPGGIDAFAGGIAELVSEFHDRRKEGLTLGAVRIGSLLSRVLDLCRVHGVEIDPAMASIVISTLVLEGLGRSLDPSLNLIDFAVPFVLGRGRV